MSMLSSDCVLQKVEATSHLSLIVIVPYSPNTQLVAHLAKARRQMLTSPALRRLSTSARLSVAPSVPFMLHLCVWFISLIAKDYN